jgi:hypothetical protein
MTISTAIDATALFRQAYENRYTWDSNFPGYTADVTMNDGTKQVTGKAIIKADLTFEVTGIDDEPASKQVTGQLWEITIHRVNRSFEETHGENTFSYGDVAENGEAEILVGGAGVGNTYKVKDNVVTFVGRKIGKAIVNINTFDVLQTPQGYLSTGYDSLYLNPETKAPMGQKNYFTDTFTEYGGYYLLTERKINAGTPDGPAITYTFSNIEMLG